MGRAAPTLREIGIEIGIEIGMEIGMMDRGQPKGGRLRTTPLTPSRCTSSACVRFFAVARYEPNERVEATSLSDFPNGGSR